MLKMILASGSPRRSEILDRFGIDHSIVIPDVDEDLCGKKRITGKVKSLALRKAEAAWRGNQAGVPVLAADTVVVLKGKIMGKPADKREAYDMIAGLSGRWHKVVTGFCIMSGRDSYKCGHSVTRVKFRKLAASEIEAYVSTPEPYDKAGGYGIQSSASAFIEKINGCYFNVMGLPVIKILSILNKHDGTTDKMLNKQKGTEV